MDTQHSTHGSLYAYSSPGYSSFYDAWVESLFASSGTASPTAPVKKNEDITIFTEIIRGQVRSSTRGVVNVVDLGTGTGRVVCELYRELSSAISDPCGAAALGQSNSAPPASPTQISIWGIDHSAEMLDAAVNAFNRLEKELGGNPHSQSIFIHRPHWARASAAAFTDTLASTSLGLGNIDVLLLSVGTIHHLVNPQEVLSFLGELSKGLRPGSGVALISVLEEMIPASAQQGGDNTAHLEEDYSGDMAIRSTTQPGAAYVKSPTVTTWETRDVEVDADNGSPITVKSQVRTDRWTVECFDGLPEGTLPEGDTGVVAVAKGSPDRGKSVWKREMEWSLAMWDEDAFRKLVGVAGLEIEAVKRGSFQRWYTVVKRRN